MKRIAEITLIALFSFTLIFHLLVLAAVIPPDIVWGSRLSTFREIALFESISILLNALFLCIILIHAGMLRINLPARLLKGIIWGMMIVFLLNSLGNLASESSFEKAVFTPVTLIMSGCLLVLALSHKQRKRQIEHG